MTHPSEDQFVTDLFSSFTSLYFPSSSSDCLEKLPVSYTFICKYFTMYLKDMET